jgi:hypothetical protein
LGKESPGIANNIVVSKNHPTASHILVCGCVVKRMV